MASAQSLGVTEIHDIRAEWNTAVGKQLYVMTLALDCQVVVLYTTTKSGCRREAATLIFTSICTSK